MVGTSFGQGDESDVWAPASTGRWAQSSPQPAGSHVQPVNAAHHALVFFFRRGVLVPALEHLLALGSPREHPGQIFGVRQCVQLVHESVKGREREGKPPGRWHHDSGEKNQPARLVSRARTSTGLVTRIEREATSSRADTRLSTNSLP